MINILTCKRMILKYINIFVHVFMETSKSNFFYSYLYLLALPLKYNTNDMGKVSTYYDPSYQP